MLRLFFLLMLSLWSSVALAGDTLAVLYFQNEGNPELTPLRVGLAQMLITDLQPTEGLTVVERQKLQAILDELELGHSKAIDKKTAVKVGKLIGARYILMGGYFELVGTLRIDARVVDVQTGEIVHAHGVNGQTTGFLELQKELAGSVGRHFAGTASTDTARNMPPPKEPGQGATRGDPAADDAARVEVVRHDGDTVKAALAYSEGLIFLDKKETARAREAFEKAVAEDPDLQAARASLAALEL